jgi:hypothetical protein
MDNMDILDHFIDFMTCEMQWRMLLLSVTVELILYTLKLVFHWNVASMSHVHVDVSYVALQAHGIVNVALHREYSLGIVFIFSKGRKYLYHV